MEHLKYYDMKCGDELTIKQHHVSVLLLHQPGRCSFRIDVDCTLCQVKVYALVSKV